MRLHQSQRRQRRSHSQQNPPIAHRRRGAALGGVGFLPLLLPLDAADEVVALGARVRDERVQLALVVEDDAVRTRRAARVDLGAREDRELVPRGRRGEVKVLEVLVLVRVFAAAWIRGARGRTLSVAGSPGAAEREGEGSGSAARVVAYRESGFVGAGRSPSSRPGQCPSADSSWNRRCRRSSSRVRPAQHPRFPRRRRRWLRRRPPTAG